MPGSESPVRSNLDTFYVEGVWKGAGDANMTQDSATYWGRGIASVNYNAAAGKFIITLQEQVGGQQLLPGSHVTVHRAAGAAPLVCNIVADSWSASARTINVEFWDVATPSLTSPATTDRVHVHLAFSKQKPFS